MTYEVWNEDCIEGMKNHIPSDFIDLIFTDPPYGIDGDSLDELYNRKKDKVVSGYIDVPLSTYDQFSKDWISECARTLKPGGSIYIVSGYTNLHHVLNALHSTELEEVNHIIAEYSFGVSTKYKWVSSHYHVLFWCKPGKKRTFNTFARYKTTKESYHDRLSVQKLPRDYKAGKIRNKNQLSEKFIEKFIRYSSNEGDVVMDPFCGGFTTARVALCLNRQFKGFELNKNAFDVFVPDLAEINQLEKFS